MTAATSPTTPLAGVRVLDLSRVLAGPWCTQTLADLGADVIKIARPIRNGSGGDDTRGWGPPFLRDREGHDTTEAAYYLGTNRNKRSVTVDIARPQGQALIRRLAERSPPTAEWAGPSARDSPRRGASGSPRSTPTSPSRLRRSRTCSRRASRRRRTSSRAPPT